MARKHQHTHLCWRCRQSFACDGELEFNYDGEPEVVCVVYHHDGQNECETCATTDWCQNCGEHPATVTEMTWRLSMCAGCYEQEAVLHL